MVAHALVGSVCDGEDMRRHLVPSLAEVDLDGGGGVDGEPFVGVDGNTEEAGVGVDQLADIPEVEDESKNGIRKRLHLAFRL